MFSLYKYGDWIQQFKVLQLSYDIYIFDESMFPEQNSNEPIKEEPSYPVKCYHNMVPWYQSYHTTCDDNGLLLLLQQRSAKVLLLLLLVQWRL